MEEMTNRLLVAFMRRILSDVDGGEMGFCPAARGVLDLTPFFPTMGTIPHVPECKDLTLITPV